MLLIALFVIALGGLAFGGFSFLLCLVFAKNNATLRQRVDIQHQSLELLTQAVTSFTAALEALHTRQTNSETNVKRIAEGMNVLAKNRTNENIASMVLASIPSGLLPQA